MSHRLVVSYLGTRFAGWQRQANAVAVQQVLEEALADLVGRPFRTMGAGRTDAGVHALGQVVSFSEAAGRPASALVYGTNARLPPDVRVLEALPVPEAFDARRDARWKEYRYRFRREAVLAPLWAGTTVRVDPGIDVAAMRRAGAALVGRHDFTAFAKTGGTHTDPRRTIFALEWREEGSAIELRVVGDGFLRGMVRAIAGTLLEVGRGVREEEDVARLVTGAPRSRAGPTAPAAGLVLWRVGYEDWSEWPGTPEPTADPSALW